MNFHQVMNITDYKIPIASAVGHHFHSPGYFILTVDCPPFERQEAFGLPTYIYPYATVLVQDALASDRWIQVAQQRLDSIEPITFQVSGLVRLSLGWHFGEIKNWKIEERWTFKKIQVVVPVASDQIAAASSSHSEDN